MHSKRLVVAAGLVAASFSGRVAAQPAIEDVRIEYRAAAECPSEAWLVARIQARTDRFRRIADERSARTFGIEIAKFGTGYVGNLTITEAEPGARATSRRIEAPNCTEVAEGLALIAALTIDPRASGEAQVEEPAPEQPAPPAPVAASPPPRQAAAPPPRIQKPAEPRGLELRIGAGFVGSHGVGPERLYGGEGFLEVAQPANRGWFAPALRLTFLRHVRRDDIGFNEGTAHFRLSTMAVDLCPLRAPVRVLELRPCITAEGGYLEAEGTDTADNEQTLRGWVAVGGRLRLGAQLQRIGVEASLGAEAPLRRDRFAFDAPRGQVDIGEVDVIVLFAGLSVSVRIN